MRCVKKPASMETSYRRPNIPESLKDNWALGGSSRAGSANAFEHDQRTKMLSYEKTGPFGSADPLLPIDIDSARDALNSDRAVGTFLCLRAFLGFHALTPRLFYF